jgi:hypothetical protein
VLNLGFSSDKNLILKKEMQTLAKENIWEAISFLLLLLL